MVQRSEIVAVSDDTPVAEILVSSLKCRFSRLPLHSFPTRRSSDLRLRPPEGAGGPSGSSARTGCGRSGRSEEHTSELQSRQYLVCRLLLEKKIARDRLDRRAGGRGAPRAGVHMAAGSVPGSHTLRA